MFHDLYDHDTPTYPALSIQEIFRIGDLWINITPQYQYFFDAPVRHFEMRKKYSIARHIPSGITTFTGKHIQTSASVPMQMNFSIEDIVQGLSNQCKYFGQTTSFYSIAQHSLLVASILPEALQPAALLYDALAAYIGEMAQELKWEFSNYRRYENRLRDAVARRFGVSIVDFEHPLLKEAQSTIMLTEKRDLLPALLDSTIDLDEIKPLDGIIIGLSPEEVKHQFIAALKNIFH